MSQLQKKALPLSAGLCNASLLLYMVWLLLPAVQTTGGALAGACTVGLFALGVLLDTDDLRRQWPWLLARAACAVVLPLLLWQFLERGSENKLGFYAQQVMFWYPLIYCAYARERGDERLWHYVKPVLLGVVTLTTLTTIGWLVQGMLRGGRVYAYSRSLGFALPGQEAYLKELMLRNIGGYDFVYATVLLLPLTCIAIQAARGWKRVGFSALLCAQAVMVVLSQYTYAMVFTAGILAAEAVAAILRAASRGRMKLGVSLLWGLVPIAAVALLHRPLLGWAAALCEQVGFTSFAFSLNQLLVALEGGVTEDTARLSHYLLALEGIARSPFLGSMLGGETFLSQHSDLLDLFSGMGVIGAASVGGMIWLMGRGSLRGVRACPYRAQLAVLALAFAATALLGTVVYSRDVMLVAAVGTALVLRDGQKARSAHGMDSADCPPH
ncbi:MAG: hypothetical protein RSC91_06000 [Clostridia bacterium]